MGGRSGVVEISGMMEISSVMAISGGIEIFGVEVATLAAALRETRTSPTAATGVPLVRIKNKMAVSMATQKVDEASLLVVNAGTAPLGVLGRCGNPCGHSQGG